MLFYKNIRICAHLRRLSSTKEISELKKSASSSTGTSGVKSKRVRFTKPMLQFFHSDPDLLKVVSHIPDKYLRQNSLSRHYYLVCPKIAKDIVDKIMPFLDLSGKQLIAETNAGLGLITLELLKRGVPKVRMYEPCAEFRQELRVSKCNHI